MRLPRFFALLLAFRLPLGALMAANPPAVVIATYNVENYLGEEAVAAETGGRRSRPKAEKAIDAVVQVIKDINPDILGVCEMGEPERFEDFKRRLAGAGLGYRDFEYVQALDSERHLALVSRFPIVARQSLTNVSFELAGRPEKVRRGFLDVTVQIASGYQLRVVGAHLKSKLPTPEGEALVRRNEALLLRKHLDEILAADPAVRLVCLGDFNDLKNEPSYHEITGARGKTYMTALPARDELGDTWTEYWKAADLYSRIDYIFVSPALHREVAPGSPRVYRSAYWNDASDHRPVYATIIPSNRP
ncbi:MAG: endonuclease/exonuclease/phosphatase family protein [Chthoniobacter sp.]|uniref:endonuclease/exonuclease/phosphatase family protein n=1 Tax=Chthoniobacter sp. TaxID=2510640 RepID=UPI0032AB3012